MKQRLLFLSEAIEAHVSKENYDEQQNKPSRSRRIERMKKLLSIAMRLELTEKQKSCVQLYYFENRKVSDIAQTLHIRPTTVYKHIRKARAALSKCKHYLALYQ